MGRTYKRNDLYVTHKAKSLREKRKQSRPNRGAVPNKLSTQLWKTINNDLPDLPTK